MLHIPIRDVSQELEKILGDDIFFYSDFQLKVLEARLNTTYRTIVRRFGFSSEQQLSSFLYRTILGFRLEGQISPSGAIPIIADILIEPFKKICLEQAEDLNALSTSKAFYILEDLLSNQAAKSYLLAQELNCPRLGEEALERYEKTLLSSAWFNEFCAAHGLRLMNPQNLEKLRQKYCNKDAITKFYEMLARVIHQCQYLLYNMDETSCCTNKKGKIVVPEGKFPVVSEERYAGHITCICTCNAAGEALQPFIILPMLMKLPEELNDLQNQCYFVTTPSGWMSSKIFVIWALFFAAEVNRRRQQLVCIEGNEILSKPCFLFVDGHKSRVNSDAIEILCANNIRVIVLPAHTSHVTQPFDVALAGPFKSFLKAQSYNFPLWLQQKLCLFCPTAQKRYTLILHIIDSWKKAATISNIRTAWEKSGIFPYNIQRVLNNEYVRKNGEPAGNETTRRRQLEINGMEITTPEKRLELARHCKNNPYLFSPMPIPCIEQLEIRNGKEKLLSHHPPLLVNMGHQGWKNLII